MNLKLCSVSQICFIILWVTPFPRGQSRGSREGRQELSLPPCQRPCPLLLRAPCLHLLDNVYFPTASPYLCLWKHFTNSSSASGSCALVCMDWELGMTPELAGMVQILHVEGWELIQGGWEEKNDQTEKLGCL